MCTKTACMMFLCMLLSLAGEDKVLASSDCDPPAAPVVPEQTNAGANSQQVLGLLLVTEAYTLQAQRLRCWSEASHQDNMSCQPEHKLLRMQSRRALTARPTCLRPHNGSTVTASLCCWSCPPYCATGHRFRCSTATMLLMSEGVHKRQCDSEHCTCSNWTQRRYRSPTFLSSSFSFFSFFSFFAFFSLFTSLLPPSFTEIRAAPGCAGGGATAVPNRSLHVTCCPLSACTAASIKLLNSKIILAVSLAQAGKSHRAAIQLHRRARMLTDGVSRQNELAQQMHVGSPRPMAVMQQMIFQARSPLAVSICPSAG